MKIGSKLRIFVLIAVALAVVYWFFGDVFSIENLAAQEEKIRRYYEAHPWAAIWIAFWLYVFVTGVSFPGGTILTLTYGWIFKFTTTLCIVSFASTLGATIAFLTSRYFFQEALHRRFGERLVGFNQRLEREGAFYLFTLRLIPLFPFFIVNLVMGLTTVSIRTYWWVSQIGMLPVTMVNSYAGSTLPSLSELMENGVSGLSPQLYIAFTILGLFPIATKRLLERWRAGFQP